MTIITISKKNIPRNSRPSALSKKRIIAFVIEPSGFTAFNYWGNVITFENKNEPLSHAPADI